MARMAAALGSKAGRQFIAITDPETALHKLAGTRGYRATFINPADIGLGEGNVTSGTRLLRQLADSPNGTDLAECAAEPKLAPAFPQYGLRTRP